MMKKFLAALIACLMCVTFAAGCADNTQSGENPGGDTGDVGGQTPGDDEGGEPGDEEQPPQPHQHTYVYADLNDNEHTVTCSGCDDVNTTGQHSYESETSLTCTLCGHIRDWLTVQSDDVLNNLSAGGYVAGKIGDFSQYVGTEAYRTVSTADELIEAISDAKYHYTNVWDNETSTYTQVPAEGYTEDNFEGTVHVIEITEDIDLGYNTLSDEAKANTSIVEDFCRRSTWYINELTMSDMFIQSGMSQIKVENTSNLLIYSKNGAKLTHGGFKLTSCDNVVFRNLEFDELWQWEDTSNASTTAVVGDYDAFGWAYFKISFCGYVWIDHCDFGKSYDGQIDYSNVDYTANSGVAFRAPYGADGSNGLHISWCNFNAGSDDKDGYLYKMMAAIEEDYQAGGSNYLYYNALRDGGLSFEEILYGLAIPQKKGFLLGDDNKQSEPEYAYNLRLRTSFANCTFTNLEDRLPKLRGGNVYMYNCVADSSQYYEYRTLLRSRNAASMVTKVNSKWKCALVSQGIVCGNGGSVMAENCIFLGIDSLLKHNDKKATGEYVRGGYQLINCSYRKGADDEVITGSTTDSGNKFPSSGSSNLKTEYFSWHADDGSDCAQAPFTPAVFAIEELESILADSTFGAGASAAMGDKSLTSNYLVQVD